MQRGNETDWERFRKVGIPVIVIALCFVLLMFIVSEFFIEGSTNVTNGGEDITIINPHSGNWYIHMFNDGLASSKNINLSVYFSPYISIDEEGIIISRQPDYQTIRDNIMFMEWNTLGGSKDIYLTVHVTSAQDLNNYRTPLGVTVSAKDEGLIYIYP